jgi:acyl carrier protein
MTHDDAIVLIEEAANAERGTVRGNEALEQINWDSMATLSFIALVDDRLGRELDVKVVVKCQTVPDLLAILLEPSGG